MGINSKRQRTHLNMGDTWQKQTNQTCNKQNSNRVTGSCDVYVCCSSLHDVPCMLCLLWRKPGLKCKPTEACTIYFQCTLWPRRYTKHYSKWLEMKLLLVLLITVSDSEVAHMTLTSHKRHSIKYKSLYNNKAIPWFKNRITTIIASLVLHTEEGTDWAGRQAGKPLSLWFSRGSNYLRWKIDWIVIEQVSMGITPTRSYL